MSKFLQVSCYVVTVFLVSLSGVLFQHIIFSEKDELVDLLPGKPLPYLTDFLMQNQHAIMYLFLFPWLIFVSAPVITRERYSFWDASLFMLRFSLFLAVEVALILFFALGCIMPWLGIIQSLGETEPRRTWFENLTCGIFWLTVSAVVIALVWPFFRNRKK